ncbi:MAG: ABC transporter ATP-binding protein [Oligoflexia bacterium]|jgi:ATP-binding cassette subfamily B multidrug efflux pump
MSAGQGFWKKTALLRSVIWKYRFSVLGGLGTLVVVDALEVLPPILLKLAVDSVTGARPLSHLHGIAGVYLLISVLQCFCRYGWRILLIRSSLFAGRDLRDRFSAHLFRLPIRFFDQKRLGDLMSLSTNDTEAIRMALGPGLLVAADALFYFVTVPVAMLMLSPQLTLLAFLPLPIIPWLVARNEKALYTRFEKVQESFGKLSALAQETLTGIRVIKAFAAEPAQMERFSREGQRYLQLNMAMAWVQNTFGPLLDFTMSMGLVILLWVGGHEVIDGNESLGTFVAFQRYIQKMVWPMAAVGMAISYLQRAVASAGRIEAVLNEAPTRRPEDEDCGQPGQRETSHSARGEIEFNNLSFRYADHLPWVIRDFSLKVPAGSRVAFLGSIGSGKSTLLSLIPRLYTPPRGTVFVDGVDVNDWNLADLRKAIGHVGQELFLFSETIEQNLSWGLPEPLAPESRDELIHQVALSTDVSRLSGGWETRLGERGINLSGGQKQRLTIGRALARRPKILILDDALSAVDTQTESRLLGALRQRSDRATELIAGHRISTLQDADFIVVLEKGRKVQQGGHRELLKDRAGLYRTFYEHQKLEEELESHGQSHSKDLSN